jgi:hypothetical protein
VDWVWIATTCLWERWQPDLPNMEMVDDKMQAGYAAIRAGDTVHACRLWLETWQAILGIIDRAEMDSLDEFDDRFGGTQCVFNWVQELEMQLHNAGLEEPKFFRERISLCETMLDRFAGGRLSIDNFKMAVAESHFELGDREKGDRLFRAWLEESPQWGSGWIAWSDCHWLFAKSEHKDATRAEQILQEGLASRGVENRTHILERLQLLYEKIGRTEEAPTTRLPGRHAIRSSRESPPSSLPRFMSLSRYIRTNARVLLGAPSSCHWRSRSSRSPTRGEYESCRPRPFHTNAWEVRVSSPSFRTECHVILESRTPMCQTLVVLHTLCLLPNRASPGTDRAVLQDTPEPLSPHFSRAREDQRQCVSS